MKKFLTLILSFVLGICIVNAETTKENATFVRCVDGDTALFKINDEEIKFRFLAIDTPETVHPTKEVEAYGKDASEYTCNKLTNAQYIVVEYENSNKKDKYGRSLAWIWVDGSLLQKELVAAGYAEVAYIYGNYKYTESLCVVQQSAIANNVGVWADGRKEGYCATLDLLNAKDTIDEDYDKPKKNKKDEEKVAEDLTNETLDKIDSANDKLEEFNNLDVNNALFYIIIGFAAAYIVLGKIRKK